MTIFSPSVCGMFVYRLSMSAVIMYVCWVVCMFLSCSTSVYEFFMYVCALMAVLCMILCRCLLRFSVGCAMFEMIGRMVRVGLCSLGSA